MRCRQNIRTGVEYGHDDIIAPALHCVGASVRGVHTHLVPLLVVEVISAGLWVGTRRLGGSTTTVRTSQFLRAGNQLLLNVFADSNDLRVGGDGCREVGVGRCGGNRANLRQSNRDRATGTSDDAIDVGWEAVGLIEHDSPTFSFVRACTACRHCERDGER